MIGQKWHSWACAWIVDKESPVSQQEKTLLMDEAADFKRLFSSPILNFLQYAHPELEERSGATVFKQATRILTSNLNPLKCLHP